MLSSHQPNQQILVANPGGGLSGLVVRLALWDCGRESMMGGAPQRNDSSQSGQKKVADSGPIAAAATAREQGGTRPAPTMSACRACKVQFCTGHSGLTMYSGCYSGTYPGENNRMRSWLAITVETDCCPLQGCLILVLAVLAVHWPGTTRHVCISAVTVCLFFFFFFFFLLFPLLGLFVYYYGIVLNTSRNCDVSFERAAHPCSVSCQCAV